MALGGGTFVTQNKILPGSYINFVSAARATSTIGERGYAALPIELDWGLEGEVMTIEAGDLQKNSMALFGYDYTSEKLNPLKDLFKHAKIGYLYRLNSGGIKASNDYAVAQYSGIRGNDLRIVISEDVDQSSAFHVSTYLGDSKIDEQIVETTAELVPNAYIGQWKEKELVASAGIPLTGGSNKSVTGDDYQTFLNKIEAYSFNTLGCLSEESTIKDLFVQFTKRMRDEVGVKFQTVVHNHKADFEGVINVKNTTVEGQTALIPWVTGASAGCEINRSNTNKTYNGAYTIHAEYTQKQLEECINVGEFVFHKCGDEVRVLDDINSFTSTTVDKNEDFQENQVIRILDQIGNDIAQLFNTKYLGKVQNNASGRIAFWNEIDNYNKQLEQIQAIENYNPDDLVVEKGNDKKSVVVTNPVIPVCCMSKLYMYVVVS